MSAQRERASTHAQASAHARPPTPRVAMPICQLHIQNFLRGFGKLNIVCDTFSGYKKLNCEIFCKNYSYLRTQSDNRDKRVITFTMKFMKLQRKVKDFTSKQFNLSLSGQQLILPILTNPPIFFYYEMSDRLQLVSTRQKKIFFFSQVRKTLIIPYAAE